MGMLTVQTLLDQSRGDNGHEQRKLTTDERRRVVAWITTTQPEVTNIDMGEWFGVGESTIRKDRLAIRQAMAKEVKEDDIGLVVADILWDFKRQIADLELSKGKTSLGGKERRMHIEAIMDMRLKTVKALQDLGYLPKMLGNMTVEKFDYAAVVQSDGSVETRPLDLFDKDTQRRVLTGKNTAALPEKSAQSEPEVIEAEAEYVDEDQPPLPPGT